MEVHFFQKSFSDLAERIFLLTDKYSSDNKKKKNSATINGYWRRKNSLTDNA